MFRLRKKDARKIGVNDAEHIISVSLSLRGELINSSMLIENDLDSFRIIGEAFTKNQNLVNDELDALMLYFVVKILNNIGAEDADIRKAIARVFGNFEITQDVNIRMMDRLEQYHRASEGNIGLQFLTNVASILNKPVDFQPSDKFVKRLDKFELTLKRNIEKELATL